MWVDDNNASWEDLEAIAGEDERRWREERAVLLAYHG